MTKKRSSPEGFMVRCLGCSYSARFGVARINAELACVRHRNRFHHQIGLYEVNLAYLFGELEGQQTLIFDDDKPPF